MTEPRKHQSPTGRLEHKVPTLQDWATYKRQAALYLHAMYQEIQELPPGDHQINYAELEAKTLASYAKTDAEFTLEWWRKFPGPYGEPVLVNKLRGRAQQTIFSLNDLIHPDTVQAMTPKPPTVTSQPLYDDDWRAYGCGCVR